MRGAAFDVLHCPLEGFIPRWRHEEMEVIRHEDERVDGECPAIAVPHERLDKNRAGGFFGKDSTAFPRPGSQEVRSRRAAVTFWS